MGNNPSQPTPSLPFQVNVGKVCNQTCHHCHVDAGPQRTESMTKDTIDQIIEVLDRTPQISTVDITGGAPEMNPSLSSIWFGNAGFEIEKSSTDAI